MVLGILPGVLPELLFTDSCAIVGLLTLAERVETLTKIELWISADRHPRECALLSGINFEGVTGRVAAAEFEG
jgi:hypothetical protein